MILFINFVSLLPLALVQGHGNMVSPPSWFDVGGKGGLSVKARCENHGGYDAGGCMWFTNETFIPGDPTLPEEFRTYQDIEYNGVKFDFTKVI